MESNEILSDAEKIASVGWSVGRSVGRHGENGAVRSPFFARVRFIILPVSTIDLRAWDRLSLWKRKTLDNNDLNQVK